MAKSKQYVFSARTTEAGLRLLNQLKAERGIGWDDLVIDAVCAHYGLERTAMVLPKAEKPAKETKQARKVGKGESGKSGVTKQKTAKSSPEVRNVRE